MRMSVATKVPPVKKPSAKEEDKAEKSANDNDESFVTADETSMIVEKEEQPKEETPAETPQETKETSEEPMETNGITETKLEKADTTTPASEESKPEPPQRQESAERPQRRRKWGSTLKQAKAKTSLSISTDSLKSLIPDVKVSLAETMKEDVEPPVEKASSPEDERHIKIERTVIQDVSEVEEDTRQIEIKERNDEEELEEGEARDSPPAKTRRVSTKEPEVTVVADEPEVARKSPSPPRNPASNIVHVRNLTRPYTLGQLKELLGRTGTLVPGSGFWIDKIKSHCYATYEDESQAAATRKALHGTRWPLSNPKTLNVDFATQDELEFHKNGDLPPKTITREIQQDVPAKTRPVRDEEGSREVRVKDERAAAEKARREHVREWDRDKIKQRSKSRSPPRRRSGEARTEGERMRSTSRERRRKERREREKKAEKPEEEAPAKLLDDLFCKTKATPCIYWLPLTEEQVLQRERERQKRQQQREQRLQQMERQNNARRESRDRDNAVNERRTGQDDRRRPERPDRSDKEKASSRGDRGRPSRERERERERDGRRR